MHLYLVDNTMSSETLGILNCFSVLVFVIQFIEHVCMKTFHLYVKVTINKVGRENKCAIF